MVQRCVEKRPAILDDSTKPALHLLDRLALRVLAAHKQ